MSNKTYLLLGTLTADQPLATASKDLIDREKKDNQPIPIPTVMTSRGRVMYFPGTGIRGKLRRAAVEVVREAVAKRTGKEKPFNLDEHYLLTLGGIKGSGTVPKISPKLYAECLAKNPLIAVFGAGDAGILGFVRGQLSVGNAFCSVDDQPVIFSGARSDEFTRNREAGMHLPDEEADALVSRMEGNQQRSKVSDELKKVEAELKKATKAKDEDQIELLTKLQAALKAQIEGILKETGAESNSVGMPLAGFKAIPPGAVMEQRMMLHNSTPIALGLVLSSLARFAINPILGGHINVGCGQVSGEWEVREVDADSNVSLGFIKMNAYEQLHVEGEALKSAISAFKTFVAEGDADFSIPTGGKALKEEATEAAGG